MARRKTTEEATEKETTGETTTTTGETQETETATEDELFGEETTIRVMLWDRGNAAPGTTTEDNALTNGFKDKSKNCSTSMLNMFRFRDPNQTIN